MPTIPNITTTNWAAFQRSPFGQFVPNEFGSRNVTITRRTGGYMPQVFYLFITPSMRVTQEFHSEQFEPGTEPQAEYYLEGAYGGAAGLASYDDDWRNWERVLALHKYYTDFSLYAATRPPRNAPNYRSVVVPLYGTVSVPVIIRSDTDPSPHYAFVKRTFHGVGEPVAPGGRGFPRGVSPAGLPLRSVRTYTPSRLDSQFAGFSIVGEWDFGALDEMGVSSFDIWSKMIQLSGYPEAFQYYYRPPYDRNYRASFEWYNNTDGLVGAALFRVEDLSGIGLTGTVWQNAAERINNTAPEWNGTQGSVAHGRWLRIFAENVESRFPAP